MPRPEVPPAPTCPTDSAGQSSTEDSSAEQPLASTTREPKTSNRQSTRNHARGTNAPSRKGGKS